MADSWIKFIRSDNTVELLKEHPNALLLLMQIAIRARRIGSNIGNLEPGEALIGDFWNCGLTSQKYKTAKDILRKLEFITTRITNRGTIAKLIDTSIFNINSETDNQQNNKQVTSRQPADEKKVTTNKKKKEKKERMKEEEEEGSEILTELFLSTLSPELQSKIKTPDKKKWSCCFDLLLKEFDLERLKGLILFYRKDNFWRGNFQSPLKLLRKNKDEIRFVDYFFERMKSGSNNSSLSVGAARPEPEPERDPVPGFMENFPEPLKSLRHDFENHYKSGNGKEELEKKLVALFSKNEELKLKVELFLRSLKPSLKTPEIEHRYKVNFLFAKFNIPEIEVDA